MPDREAIRSNAQYLRNVRPIDPEEICEYVEGQPHPAVVAQVLREEAASLGLVERDDGTFVPVPDEPVPVPDLPVTAFPESYARRLEELLVERFGSDWHRGDSGDELRARLRELKRSYHRGWDVEYDDVAALAYAIYHLPDYYAAVQYVLAELAEVDLLDPHLRVLDVGAGVGGPALGIYDALPDDALIEYEAVEPSAAADVFEAMLAETGPNFDATIHRTTAEAFDAEGGANDTGDRADENGSGYDLVLFGNVLSELDDPDATARRYLDVVADDGSLALLSPADRETSATLRSVERSLADDREAAGNHGASSATVFSPTVRLWPGESPGDEGWSFVVRPDLAVPPFQRRLDEPVGAEGEFVNVDVQYAYSILRRDDVRRIEYRPERSQYAKLAESEEHVSDRVDAVAAKLSDDLAAVDRGGERSGGANPLFRIGDGSQQVDHFAVLTRETALNAPLQDAAYGDLLTFESVLVLWNDDEGAYNLVVDDETVVDAVPAPYR